MILYRYKGRGKPRKVNKNMLYNGTTNKDETIATLKELIQEVNYRVRGRFTSIAGDFEDLGLDAFVKECYNIVDAVEKLEYLIKEETGE